MLYHVAWTQKPPTPSPFHFLFMRRSDSCMALPITSSSFLFPSISSLHATPKLSSPIRFLSTCDPRTFLLHLFPFNVWVEFLHTCWVPIDLILAPPSISSLCTGRVPLLRFSFPFHLLFMHGLSFSQLDSHSPLCVVGPWFLV